jgi:hypothetical protein
VKEHPRVTRERIAGRANRRIREVIIAIEAQKKVAQHGKPRARRVCG